LGKGALRCVPPLLSLVLTELTRPFFPSFLRLSSPFLSSFFPLFLLPYACSRLTEPQYLHPHLHKSSVPLCLHAYALSNTGAQTVLSLLNNPWTAYQTAVDTAVPSFISFSLLNSFSVEPPLIIQRKDGPSDIQAGIGSKWRGLLMDSTVDRIRAANGEEVFEEVYDPNNLDPATVFRYGNNKKCHI
jgi:hypothetical protein